MTRDERSDLDDEPEAVRWNDRAILGTFKGLPWWVAVAMAFVLAVIGTYIDVSSSKTVGWIFTIAFFAGCVAAICLVQRRSMFGPIVQPPLVLAITVPMLVVFTQGVPTGGLSSMALGLGKPLIDGFPTMAVTTIFTVAIGVTRIFIQRDPNRPTKDEVREAKASVKADRVDRKSSRAAADEEQPEKPRPAGRERTGSAPRRRPTAGAEDKRPRRSAPEGEPRRRPRPPEDPSSGRIARPEDPSSGRVARPAPNERTPRQGGRPTPGGRVPGQEPPARGGRPTPPRRPRPRGEDDY